MDNSIQNSSLSRFYQSTPIVVNNIVTFGRWDRPNWMNEENVSTQNIITLKINQNYAGRPDLIANDYYNSPFLEWVVILFNRPLEPLGFPKAGSVIKIPSSKIVSSNL